MAWVYIMTNKPNGLLYIGVTTDLHSRVVAHRRGKGSVFTAKYNCRKLVYCERLAIAEARARERALKAWKRQWKIELIERVNPGWVEIQVVDDGV